MTQEKVAIVTAGGSGMGAGAARKLAEDGFRVAILSSSGKGEALAKELGGVGVTGSNQSNDDVKRLVDLAMDERDHSTNRFLQWFVEEQIEEEATFSKLLDVTRQSTNLLLIDQYVSRMEPEGGPDEGA